MGINICLLKDWSHEHPDWEAARHAGDRDFLEWTAALPREKGGPDGECFRPVDLDRWMAALPTDRPNPDRFPQLLKLLADNPDYWLYYSY
ncbi:MAG: hypothetical protein Q7J28_15570 [Caulobacter sp.]|nr:hypothetical protein [Caulobacter sp.]